VLGIIPVLPTPIGPPNRDYPTDAFREMRSCDHLIKAEDRLTVAMARR
jgi:hypothetical protein